MSVSVRTTQHLAPYLETTYTKKVVKILNKRAGTNNVTIPVRNVNCWVPLQVPSERVVSSFLACLDWPQITPMPVQQHDENVKTIFLSTIHIHLFKFIFKRLLCPSTLCSSTVDIIKISDLQDELTHGTIARYCFSMLQELECRF